MDHNQHHHQEDLIDILGSGLGAKLNIVIQVLLNRNKEDKEASLEEQNKDLDLDVHLPWPLGS